MKMNDVFEKSKITEYQKLICQLEGVLSVQFVTNASGELEELHVLANKERNPKQLVRDIQSAMYAQYNLDVDYKVISIAQIDQDSIKSLCRNTRTSQKTG